jgi:beta-phosphoglucomutase-like phosphatase (HAD superfamily)
MKGMKRKIAPVNQDELEKEEDRIKRRKTALSVESTTKSKPKQEILVALKALLADYVAVTTHKEYVNTRPVTRLTGLIHAPRVLSVNNAYQTTVFKGTTGL